MASLIIFSYSFRFILLNINHHDLYRNVMNNLTIFFWIPEARSEATLYTIIEGNKHQFLAWLK